MEYRIVRKEAFRVVGVRDPINIAPESTDPETGKMFDPVAVEESFKRIPEFWKEEEASGNIGRICGFIDNEPKGLLGVSDCTHEGGSNFYYIAAATERAVPEGMYEFTVPSCTWAIFPGSGLPSSISDLMKRIYAEWLPTSGYEWDNAPDIEVYLDDNPVNMRYEVWLPVVRKG